MRGVKIVTMSHVTYHMSHIKCDAMQQAVMDAFVAPACACTDAITRQVFALRRHHRHHHHHHHHHHTHCSTPAAADLFSTTFPKHNPARTHT